MESKAEGNWERIESTALGVQSLFAMQRRGRAGAEALAQRWHSDGSDGSDGSLADHWQSTE